MYKKILAYFLAFSLCLGLVNPVQAASTETLYRVKKGDTLWLISQRYKTTVSKLISRNKLKSTGLWIGQKLYIQSTSNLASRSMDYGGKEGYWYRVKQGESLDSLALKTGISEAGLYKTNQLASSILMLGQPLFIPSTNHAVVAGVEGYKKDGFGEFLTWNYAQWVYTPRENATVVDLSTGKEFNVRCLGGSNHADSEPLTSKDTKIMASLYPKGWSWNTRPILLKVDNRMLAASIAGMPHDVRTIYDNNFNGHFDVYFYNEVCTLSKKNL
jgi:LysM repeat protein